jgi:hypothetical protein
MALQKFLRAVGVDLPVESQSAIKQWLDTSPEKSEILDGVEQVLNTRPLSPTQYLALPLPPFDDDLAPTQAQKPRL